MMMAIARHEASTKLALIAFCSGSLLSLVGCGAGVAPGNASISTIHRTTSVAPRGTPAVIVIDGAVGEKFEPTSATADMSADQAWSVFATQNALDTTAIPSDVTSMLGYLTLPVGPGKPSEFTANDELSWGYSWHSCPPNMGRVPVQAQCTEWVFLNASTGDLIDQTWQQ